MATTTGTGITWADLYAFLTGPAHCTEVSWTPGTHVTLRQPNGREFSTCKPQKSGDVSLKHLAFVANEFGKNVTEFEIWMGRRPPGKSKLTRKRVAGKPIPPPYHKRVVSAAKDIERVAIRIAYSSEWAKTTDGAKVKLLERIASELKQAEAAL